VVMLTGYGSVATAVDAIRLGAVHYLQKPADVDAILEAFRADTDAPIPAANAVYDPPSLERVEWEHIQRVLSDCGGNVSEAARRLRIHRRSLQRKLQRWAPPE
jgi:two-component system response regulator RegA